MPRLFNRIKYLLVSVLLMTASVTTYAGVEPYAAKPLDGSKGQIAVDSSITTLDTMFTTMTATQYLAQTKRIQNIITLGINEYSPWVVPDSFKVKVTIQVDVSYLEDGVEMTASDTRELTLEHFRGNEWQHNKVGFSIDGMYYRATVTITGIDVIHGDSSKFNKVLQLENQMMVTRTYDFDCSDNAVKTITGIDSLMSSSGELFVRWGKEKSADEYDLEWSWIDSSALANYYLPSTTTPDPNKIFPGNSTRVSVTTESYRIPLLYDGSGHLFYRVRAVQMQYGGQRYESDWSSSYTGGLGRYDYSGHENNFNWQSTTSFAEEGKRKSVVQYFDGSLRGRQTVTKDNTTDTTIVAETYYDHQGRPTIQVLPAPSLSSLIKYNHNFNQAVINGPEYEKILYDGLRSGSADSCAVIGPAMDTTSGASRYYSPNNHMVNLGFHQYIPDAKRYPFSETRYTPDNTGRIARQGGVGIDHQVGTGHETRYFYGTADQEELDALFGTEAGNASHYFKNMVLDANGQYSVSYVDMHGRTVATALAGNNPSSLDSLTTKMTRTITKKLIDSVNNQVNGTAIESTKSLLVPKAGSHRFVYSLMPDSISIKDCNNTSVCYDCAYDLEVTISDECGNTQFGGSPKIIRRSNVMIPKPDSLCNPNTAFPGIDTTLVLLEGSYSVTKRLVMNQRTLAYYRDSIFTRRNSCKTLDEFIQEQRTLLNSQLQCEQTCTSCRDSLGTWDSFRVKFMNELGLAPTDTAVYRNDALFAYNKQLEACDVLCEEQVELINIRKAMLEDVTPPSGQYANVDEVNAYSIFYANPKPKYSIPFYRDDNGKTSLVTLEDGSKVIPNKLDKIAFAENFQPSWADALLPYHPEYYQFLLYQTLAASHSWDVRIDKIDTYQKAVDSGFINPLQVTSGFAYTRFGTVAGKKDPYFSSTLNPIYTSGGVSADETAMNSYLNQAVPELYNGQAVSLWRMATTLSHCDTTKGSGTCFDRFMGSDALAFNTDSLCATELDMAWRLFKQAYLSKKRELIMARVNLLATGLTPADLADNAPPFFRHFTTSGNNLLNNSGWGGTPEQQKAKALDSVKAYIDSNCHAYVQLWWDELKPCGFLTADSAIVINKLIRVCMEGGDINHVYGSSTVRPSSTDVLRSFDEVIKHYRDSTGLPYGANCNGFLITSPASFDQQPTYASLPIWGTPDSCQCTQITKYYNEYQSNKTTADSTFAKYVYRITNTAISATALDSLRKMCSGEITCNFLDQPIDLPPLFQCGVKDVCVDCRLVDGLYSTYNNKFPASAPAYEETDSLQSTKNRLFEQFMNYHLGFSKTSQEYLAFIDTCHLSATSPYNRDTLVDVMTDFRSSNDYNYFSIARPDAAGCDTTHWKINYGGPYYNVPIALKYFMKNGVFSFPDSLEPASLPINYDYYDRFCLDSGFTYKMRFRIPDSTMVNHSLGLRMDIYGLDVSRSLFLRHKDSIMGACEYIEGTGSFICNSYPTDSLDLKAWHVLDIKFTRDSVKYYLDSILLKSLKLYLPLSRFRGWSINSFYKQTEIDYIKLYDKAGALQYNEGFDSCAVMAVPNFPPTPIGNCSQLFTNYFNDRYDTTLTAPQIDSVYWVRARMHIDMCSQECGLQCDSLQKFYNDFQAKYDSIVNQVCVQTPPNYVDQYGLTCCQGRFKDYMNSRLQRNYTYVELLGLFSKCGIGIDPCTRPYTGPMLCGKTEPVFTRVNLTPRTPCMDTTLFSVMTGTLRYEAHRDSLLNSFQDRYVEKCMKAAKFESFTVTLPISEYHYTLYYYNQAGNLVKTVPPAGVDISKFGWMSNWSDSVRTASKNNQSLTPVHVLSSQYRFNTLNQTSLKKTPDDGISSYWYDRLGRLALSQNAQQKANAAGEQNRLYSYTRYDILGRINEVGQIKNNTTTAVTNTISRSESSLTSWINNSYNHRGQITRTHYDRMNEDLVDVFQPQNLRNRVAYTALWDTATNAGYSHATYYSYDIHGNVDTLIQDYGSRQWTATKNIMNDWEEGQADNRFKRIVYGYGIITGKLNWTAYNPKNTDQYFVRYNYDAEDRLANVETSVDSLIWDIDARYEYYKHGLRARMVLGNQMVQGVDYAYTIQGLLKGVNSTSLKYAQHDMGQDGRGGASSKYVGRDVFGFNLNYFTGDYFSINQNRIPFPGHGAFLPSDEYRPLYNGNIMSMAVNIKHTADTMPLLYNYRYDQLNRLTGMDTYKGLDQNRNDWAGLAYLQAGWGTKAYQERIKYDANGNILKYLRTGPVGNPDMDSLNYYYYANSNKLQRVTDQVNASQYQGDLDHQTTTENYKYDDIGNMVSDAKESINSIKWSVYGKILEINRAATSENNVTQIKYTYDASGNRISKRVLKSGANTEYTWYVRDAGGNILSTYTTTGSGTTLPGTLSQNDVSLFGNKRIGTWQRGVNAKDIYSDYFIRDIDLARGFKQYELTNHLGNVVSTISDAKIGRDTTSDGLIDFSEAVVKSATDYHPFGFEMLGRKASYGAYGYRYGFNGKENDNEAKGEGNQQDYGMRIYDPRIGRFLSLDPMQSNFPHLTPFQFAGNSPIQSIDLDGLEPKGYMEYWDPKGKEYYTKWNFTVQDYYDFETDRVWTIMHYPNTNEYYYYATKYEGALRLFKPDNTSQNKQGTEWTGKFIQFIPRYKFESADVAIKGILGTFAVAAAAPVAAEAGVVALEKISELAVNAALRGILAYWRYAPLVGKVGVKVAEVMDESGAIGLQNSAINKGVTIGLGIADDLYRHRGTGALTWKSAAWQEAGLTNVDWGKMMAGDELAIKQAFQDAAEKAASIRFDVTGFDPAKVGITQYEFQQILKNEELLKKTTFIRDEKVVIWNGEKFVDNE